MKALTGTREKEWLDSTLEMKVLIVGMPITPELKEHDLPFVKTES